MFKGKFFYIAFRITKHVIFPFVFLLAGLSCHQDVIDVDLYDIESQIVVEGSITDGNAPYTVEINRRDSPFKEGIFPPVYNAEVTVYDNAGHSETLVEVDPGIYKTHWLQGVPGRTYTLNATVDGETYTASSRMPHPVALDSVRYTKYPDPWVEEIAFLSLYFTDRKGVDDYCLFKVYVNGYLYNNKYILYHGKYTDGEQIVMDDFDSVLLLNDYVRIEMFTIDEAMFKFWNTLNMIIDSDKDGDDVDVVMFPVTLFNPTSNLSNNALGYFSAHTVRTYAFTVR